MCMGQFDSPLNLTVFQHAPPKRRHSKLCQFYSSIVVNMVPSKIFQVFNNRILLDKVSLFICLEYHLCWRLILFIKNQYLQYQRLKIKNQDTNKTNLPLFVVAGIWVRSAIINLNGYEKTGFIPCGQRQYLMKPISQFGSYPHNEIFLNTMAQKQGINSWHGHFMRYAKSVQVDSAQTLVITPIFRTQVSN